MEVKQPIVEKDILIKKMSAFGVELEKQIKEQALTIKQLQEYLDDRKLMIENSQDK